MSRMLQIVSLLALSLLIGCDGQQSAFAGAGPASSRIVFLTWLMFAGAAVITLFMAFLTWVAIWGPSSWRVKLSQEKGVIWGGIVFPVITLTVLLIYGFRLLDMDGALLKAENPVRFSVVGEQWWWRVFYLHEDGTHTESANELRFPVGRVIEIELTTADVIHSFWLPAYAGKVDMIPGRTNTLHFMADETGIVRGQCAEYCGGAHALMGFYAVAMTPEDYQDWLTRERGPALVNTEQPEGEQLFLANGCGGCHTVRGAGANGIIGPDLTHIGSRLSIGAGVLASKPENFARWIGEHQQLKPQNLMPPYDLLSEHERQALALYLSELE